MKIFRFFVLLGTLLASGQGVKKDIVFLLDRSGSLTQQDINGALSFIYNVTEYLHIGPGNIQISLVTYSDNVRTEFSLSRYSNTTYALSGINSLKGMTTGGGTYTYTALQYVLENTFTSSGSRSDAAKTVVVMTDGYSSDYTATKTMADRLRNNLNATLFSIGIGKEPDPDEINAIANDPDSYYVHSVSDFVYLCNLIPAIVPKLDSGAVATISADCPTEPGVTTTTTITTTTTAIITSSSASTSPGIIAMIIAGVLALILLILLSICCIAFMKKKKRKPKEINATYYNIEFSPTPAVQRKPLKREFTVISSNGWTSGMNDDLTLDAPTANTPIRQSSQSLDSVMYRDMFNFKPGQKSDHWI